MTEKKFDWKFSLNFHKSMAYLKRTKNLKLKKRLNILVLQFVEEKSLLFPF